MTTVTIGISAAKDTKARMPRAFRGEKIRSVHQLCDRRASV